MQNQANTADIHFNFSNTNRLEYEESTLTLVKQFSFCPSCMSDSLHKPTCVDANFGKAAFVTSKIYMHNPPKVAGCVMLDSDCVACQNSKLPSNSYNVVHICEIDLTFGQHSETTSLITADQVSYQLEMCADIFLVKCLQCKAVVSRSDYISHMQKLHG